MSELVLQVKDLKVSFSTVDGVVQAVNGISFDVRKGQTLGIVGESGSGKSVTASAIMGLINKKSADMSGSILLGGLDVLTAQEREIRALRGREAAMVFQDPMTSLNPVMTIHCPKGKSRSNPFRLFCRTPRRRMHGTVSTTAGVGVAEREDFEPGPFIKATNL